MDEGVSLVGTQGGKFIIFLFPSYADMNFCLHIVCCLTDGGLQNLTLTSLSACL